MILLKSNHNPENDCLLCTQLDLCSYGWPFLIRMIHFTGKEITIEALLGSLGIENVKAKKKTKKKENY